MMSDKRPNNRGRLVGRVIRYDDNKRQAIMKLTDDVNIGDTIDFWVKVGGRVSTNVSKIIYKNKEITSASAGMEVIIPVPNRVHPHDRIFKVFDANLMQKARSYYTNASPIRKINLNIEAIAKLNEPFMLKATDEDGYSAQITSNFIVETALKRAMDKSTVQKQMERLGNTIYQLENLSCTIDENVIVPMSVMNDTRRLLIEKLMSMRLEVYHRPQIAKIDNTIWQQDLASKSFNQTNKPQLVVAVDTIAKVQTAIDNQADIVLFGGESYNHQFITAEMYAEATRLCREANIKIAFATPRIMRDNEQTAFTNWLTKIKDIAPDMIYAHTLAQMYLIKQFTDITIWADFSFNVYNDVTLTFLNNYGTKGATVSPELNFKQIKTLNEASTLPLECIVHGNMELMVSEYCVLGSFLGNLDKGTCTKPCEKNNYWLCDRKNEKFPIVTDQYCHMHLLNAKELNMLAHVPEFTNLHIDRIRLDGRYMSKEKLAKFTKLYKEIIIEGKNHLALMPENITKYEQNITRGHYFRGVE